MNGERVGRKVRSFTSIAWHPLYVIDSERASEILYADGPGIFLGKVYAYHVPGRGRFSLGEFALQRERERERERESSGGRKHADWHLSSPFIKYGTLATVGFDEIMHNTAATIAPSRSAPFLPSFLPSGATVTSPLAQKKDRACLPS